MGALIEVDDLRVRYGDQVDALRGVSFSLGRGESLAIVGESGSGKTTLALCLMGLLQPPEAQGSVRVDGQEVMGATAEVLRELRWDRVALAPQGAPFNPVVRMGQQMAEPLRERRGMSRATADRHVAELAREVLFDPDLLDRFPHELSGGERRRALLAMALTLDPDVVVLDEPTAGLDPATRHELLERIAALASARGLGLVLITHDLPEAARLADRVMVLYAGEAAEVGVSGPVLTEPAHPYTWALVNAYPVISTTKDLRPIRGRSPDARAVPSGCPYHPRCTQAEAVCAEQRPVLAESRGRHVACHFGGLKVLLAARGISKTFRQGRQEMRALQDVWLTVREGEAVGLVGPSGSGKTTLARILAGHLSPDSGEVLLQAAPLRTSWATADRAARRRIQLVMQDPWDALSPRLTVEALLGEPLDVMYGRNGPARDEAVRTALEGVGLPSSGPFLQARSHELSGGQLQRIALARALVLSPKLLVADEPTSMLDASEQARVLTVFRERQVEMGLGLVFVSHDLAVVRKVTDRIVVLDAGRVVEEGPSEQVATAPSSPTARRLLEVSPTMAGARVEGQ